MSNDKTDRRIAHYQFGKPEEVLRLENDQPRSSLGRDSVRVRLTRSMIHPADLQLVAAHYSPTVDAVPEGRVPGMEGVGVVEEAAPGALDGTGIEVGDRVAFLAESTWQSSLVLPAGSLVAIPDDITDDVASQMLLNTITARLVLRVAQRTLGTRPSRIVLTAASSSVGKLISVLALREGIPLIRLVRSEASAARLAALLEGGDIIATETEGWQDAVRSAAEGDIPLVIDGVGGEMVTESGWLLNQGGALISFGLLGKGSSDLTMYLPKSLTLRGASIGTWQTDTDPDDQARDLEVAVEIARSTPQVFEGSTVFELSDIRNAIDAVTAPTKQGNVLLSI
ncbi:alcohol dehydrogenase catalytic domain-containing protein [Pseudomonas coronafaciens]|nr:hypothetical protein [Pseudomonas coronafaciens]